MTQRHIVFLMAAALILTAAAADGVPCSDDFFRVVCPESAPNCCRWPNGVVAACCPLESKCALEIGACVAPADGNGTTQQPTPAAAQSGGVNLGLSVAASPITGAVILFLVGTALAGFAGYRFDRWFDSRQRRRREQAARRLLESDSDSSAAEECEEEGDGDDETACLICRERRIQGVLLPCGHACCCKRCAVGLRHTCPMCRSGVSRFVQFQNVLFGRPQQRQYSGGVAAVDDRTTSPS